jgi:hypothetical protein
MRRQVLTMVLVALVVVGATIALTRMALKPPPSNQQIDEMFQ